MLNAHLPSAEDFATLPPEELAARLNGLPGTLGEKLGIRYTHVARDRVDATMPVAGNLQPAGRLHGGANVALAEELASVGSWVNLDVTKHVAVGVDINATHVRGVSSGEVTGTARLTYRGRSVMVWEIDIRDARGKTTCIARCTCNVIAL